MKKLVSTLGLFLSFLIQDIAAFQPPSQENQRLIKKNELKLSQFVTSTRGWFGGVAEIHRLIREGVLITPEDLDQLLDLGPGSDGLYNIEFWTQNGSYFLMYASMGPSTVFPEVKSLKDLAASQVSKKEKLKGRYVTQAADLRRAIRSNASLPEIEEEVTRIFAEVAAQIKKTRGGFESLQKTKIRDEFRAKGQKRLDDLWQDILATRPTGFSVVVLEYIVNALSRSEDFVSDVPLIGQGQKKEIL